MTTQVHNPKHYVHRIGTAIMTYEHRDVDLLNPEPETIQLSDIAHGLSNIARWTGHTEEFYSVAKHSILVCHLAPLHLKAAALLHDASEAYLGDLSKPLKNLLGDAYKNLECKFQQVISDRFSIPIEQFEAVKTYDLLAQEIEWEAFFLDDTDRIERVFHKYNRSGHFESEFRDYANILGIK